MPIYKKDEILGYVDSDRNVWCKDCFSQIKTDWEAVDIIDEQDLDEYIYVCDNCHTEL